MAIAAARDARAPARRRFGAAACRLLLVGTLALDVDRAHRARGFARVAVHSHDDVPLRVAAPRARIDRPVELLLADLRALRLIHLPAPSQYRAVRSAARQRCGHSRGTPAKSRILRTASDGARFALQHDVYDAPASPLRILLVNDTRQDLDVLREALHEAGNTIVGECADAIALLAMVGQTQPDVIIIDSDSPTRASRAATRWSSAAAARSWKRPRARASRARS